MRHQFFPSIFLSFTFLLASHSSVLCQPENARPATFAEKLGWKKGDRVVILHMDDAGMSFDSNQGIIQALEKGVANSISVMMPCPWVPAMVRYLKQHPAVDAGLHLTLTSEWQNYRWGPLTGQSTSPGLVDAEGALWPNVAEVVQHASPDEVEAEIRAQLERARRMGLEPTHLDSHMGTLFATPGFLERYVKVGVENGIPVMFPGGHDTFLIRQLQQEAIQQLKKEGKYQEGQEMTLPPAVVQARELAKTIWAAGLPVLDDLHNTSYGWHLPEGTKATDDNLRKMKTEKYTEAMRMMKPGVTMVIMHCTAPTEVFSHISDSGDTRKGDMLAMLDPALRKVIQQEGIILTTWRELKERRAKVK